jgi:hypothetical protein
MADRGNIGAYYPAGPYKRKIPSWLGGGLPINPILTSTQYLSEDVTGIISGTVEVAGVATAEIWVYLYYRGHDPIELTAIPPPIYIGDCPPVFIDRVKSASDGSFSFSGLSKSRSNYFCFALDPPGGVQYNIARHDRLTPV